MKPERSHPFSFRIRPLRSPGAMVLLFCGRVARRQNRGVFLFGIFFVNVWWMVALYGTTCGKRTPTHCQDSNDDAHHHCRASDCWDCNRSRRHRVAVSINWLYADSSLILVIVALQTELGVDPWGTRERDPWLSRWQALRMACSHCPIPAPLRLLS